MKRLLVLIVFALLARPSAAVVGPPNEKPWRYVVPGAGQPFEHPPLRALTLWSKKPDDVIEKIKYRGSRQRYGQLRFGSATSVRVTVVVDEIGPNEVDLYVDAGRKRTIEARDRVTGTDLTWRMRLEMHEVAGTNVTPHRRMVIFRFGTVGRILSFAAVGYLEGTVRIAGREHLARRQDGDGNGLFTDPQDRLWIDLNDDGRWDAVNEQFLYAPILTLGKERYAVRSDAPGRRLSLGNVEGTGTIRVKIAPGGWLPARVLELGVSLVGRDGMAVSMNGPAPEAVVPAGEYRVSGLTVTLTAAVGGQSWTFTFSDNGGRPKKRWYTVARNAVTTIDPVGKLELLTGLDSSSVANSGKEFEVQPQLFTGDGLLIVTCFRGVPNSPLGREETFADIMLESPAGGRLASARTGFA
jgi:hypothetical protein